MNIPLNVILAKRVREERKAKGLTQAQLSEKLDMTPETVCHIENCTASTKLSTIDKLAEIFDIDAFELFKEKDPVDFAHISGIRLELLEELEECDDDVVELVLNLLRKMH